MQISILSERRTAAGFTLVELLVVIGIIAVLAGLLLPVLSTAKKKGQGATCLSNVKQFAMGVTMYSQDHNEQFPGCASRTTYGFKTSDWIYWRSGAFTPKLPDGTLATVDKSPVAKYVGDTITANMFRCAGDKFDDARKDVTLTGRDPGPYNYSYTINSYNLEQGVNIGMATVLEGDRLISFRLSQVKNPSAKIMLAEEQTSLNKTDSSPEGIRQDEIANDGRWEPFPSSTATKTHNFLTTRHNGRATLAFADGHVEAQPHTFAEDQSKTLAEK